VAGKSSLVVGPPVALFEFRSGRLLDQPYYSVDRDGQHFLLSAIVESETNSPLTVIVNWMVGLKK
jgi:hypothetical protein